MRLREVWRREREKNYKRYPKEREKKEKRITKEREKNRDEKRWRQTSNWDKEPFKQVQRHSFGERQFNKLLSYQSTAI